MKIEFPLKTKKIFGAIFFVIFGWKCVVFEEGDCFFRHSEEDGKQIVVLERSEGPIVRLDPSSDFVLLEDDEKQVVLPKRNEGSREN